MAFQVFIDGAHGTTGLKIREYLKDRDDIEIIKIDEDKRKDINERVRLVNKADVSILCLPDEASKELVNALPDGVRLIDTSTAHRVDPDWVYGFPELKSGQRDKIRNADKVANPGCHATGFISLVEPLVESGVCAPDYPFTSFCVTGYSGGGKKMIANHQNADRHSYLESHGQYGLTQTHKHLKEMVKMTGIEMPPSFCPIVGDFYCGMVMTVPLRQELMNKKLSVDEIKDIYKQHYLNEPMIKVNDDIPEDGFIHSDILKGKNTLEIFVTGNDERPLVISRFDNLGKGASGAAVQNLNIMLGIDETKGLI